MSQRKKQGFVEGAAILTASTILIKIMGALFKLPLANIIGDERMADFGTAYNIYSLLLILSTAGLPVALSRMVAAADALDHRQQVKRTFHMARAAFFTFGLVSTLVMLLFNRQLAAFMDNPEAALSIAVLAPAVVCVCLTSSYRGYTQGLGDMVPTSVSQIIETACKLLFGLTAAAILVRTGRGMMGAAGGIFGVTVGTVLALAYIVLYTLRLDRRLSAPRGDPDVPESRSETLKKLISIGIPITIGSCILNIVAIADNKMILNLLHSAAGFSKEMAKVYYGVYFNSQTLYNLPSAFAVPLVTSAIPAITAYAAKRQHRDAAQIMGAALKLMNLLAFPMAVGMGCLSYSLMHGLYPMSHESGASILAIMSIAAYFVCLTMLTNAILQAYGHEWLPMISMLAGGVCKVLVNYLLLRNPQIGILGAAVGNIACYLVISLLNLLMIRKKVEACPSLFPLFLRPLLASLIMGGCAWCADRLVRALLVRLDLFQGGRMADLVPAVIAVVVGVVIYFLMVILLKAIKREELELVPKGEKLAKLLRL